MLVHILSWFGRRRGETQLKFVGGPTFATIRGRIASPDALESPVTERTGAVIQYAIGHRYTRSHDGKEITVEDVLATTTSSAGDVMIDTDQGRIGVREGFFEVEFPRTAIGSQHSTYGALPEELERAVEGRIIGETLYGEQILHEGDLVELTATIGSTGKPELPWQVVAESDKPIIRDLTLEDMDIDVDGLTGRRAGRQFVIGGVLIIVLLLLSPLLLRFCD